MNVKRTNNTTKNLSSRLLALILTLAMVIGVMPTVSFAADDTLLGNVSFYAQGQPVTEPVNTGERFALNFQLMYGNNAVQANQHFQLHFTNAPADSFVLEDFDKMDEGGTYSTGSVNYVLHKANDGHWYVDIDGLTAGETKRLALDAHFKNGTPDATTLTATLTDAQGNRVTSNNNIPSQANIVSKADTKMTNSVTAVPSSLALNDSDTTLGTDIDYTIKVTPDKAGADLGDGEARVTDYTVKDTVTLPDGMYILAGSNPEQAIKDAYTVDGGTNYTISNIVYEDPGINSKIKSFDVTLPTVTNDSPKTQQMSEKTHSAKLKGDKVAVDPSKFNSGTITNSVTTTFNTTKGDGTKVPHTTNPSMAATLVSVSGNGVGGASKKISSIHAFDGWYWSGRFNSNGAYGYAVKGDFIEYTITVENDSTSEKSYTVTDILSDANLKLVNRDNVPPTNASLKYSVEGDATLTNANAADGAGTVSFSFTLPGKNVSSNTNTKATIKFWTEVANDVTEDSLIENKATLTVDSNDTEIPSDPVPQKPTTKDFTIEKSYECPDFGGSKPAIINGVYAEGIGFYYVIKVKNTGTATDNNIYVSDVLPAEVYNYDDFEYDESKASFSSTNDDRKIEGTINSLAPGEEFVLKFVVDIPSDQVDHEALNDVINTATATMDNVTKSDSVTLKPNTTGLTDLDVFKHADKTTVNIGDTVNYTITIRNGNEGELEERDLYLKEVLPSGLQIIGYTPGQGLTAENIEASQNNTVFKLKGVTIPGKGEIKIILTAKVLDNFPSNKNVVNEIQLHSEPDLTEETRVLTDFDEGIMHSEAGEDAPVKIEKKAFDASGNDISGKKANPGDVITFSVKITNNTGADLSDFVLRDTYEARFANPIHLWIDSLENATYTAYSGNYQDPSDGQWYNGPHADTNLDLGTAYSVSQAASADLFNIVFRKRTENEDTVKANIASGPNESNQLTIADGGSVTFKYTVLAMNGEWVNGVQTYFTGGSNTAIITYDGGVNSSTVTLLDPNAPDPTPTPDPNATPTPVPTANPADYPTLVMTKEANKSAMSIGGSLDAQAAEAALKSDGRFTYTVTLKNTSDKPFTTTTAPTFSDKLPSGFGIDLYTGQWNGFGDDAVVEVAEYNNENDSYGSNYYTGSNGNNKVTIKLITGSGEIETTSTALVNSKRNIQQQLGYLVDGNANQGETVVDANKVTITFNEPITIPAGHCIKVSYVLAPTPNERTGAKNEETGKQGIVTERTASSDNYFAERSYKNEMTFKSDTLFNTINSNGEQVNFQKEITAVENVKIVSQQIHPGIDKAPVYTFGHSSAHLIPYGTDMVRVGHYIVWKVRVFNNKDASGGGDVMQNYTVKDTWPDGYRYAGTTYSNGSGINYTAKLYKCTSENNKQELTYVEPDVDGVFNFSAATYALQPGQWLEFEILTEPTSNEYGLYVNKVALTVAGKTLHADAIVSGTQNGDELEEKGEVPIYPVGTAATKWVKKKSDASYSISSDSPADSKRVKTTQDDTLTYKLVVSNFGAEGGNAVLEDLSIIDRLPYEGDMGVITAGKRGSSMGVRYVDNSTVKAKVTLNSGLAGEKTIDIPLNYIDIAFANDTSHVFEPTDTDWSYKSQNNETKVQWSSDWDNSTTLVRFALKNLESFPAVDGTNPFEGIVSVYDSEQGKAVNKAVYGLPTKAEISIEFDVKVPELIENTGDNYSAWNSFGYYFNSGDIENMVAEPSKVGSWVEDSSYGGNILIRKRYKSNMPNESRTFYFTVYKDAPYGQSGAIKVKTLSITLKGSDGYSQSDVYATGLTFDDSGANTPYYIYESASDGTPLTGTPVIYNDKQTKMTQRTETDGRIFEFYMDNESQIANATNQGGLENSQYLVWKKDLSVNKTTNSAIFTNIYEAKVGKEIMGPFYADVPTNQNYADGNVTSNGKDMLSSRPGEDYKAGDELAEQASQTRETDSTYADYGAGTVHGVTSKFGNLEQHTIATGFLAKLTGVGDYSLNNVTWTINFNQPTYKNGLRRADDTKDPGVYVMLKSASATSDNGEEVSLLYLDDYSVEEFIGSPEERYNEALDDIAAANEAKESAADDDVIGFDNENDEVEFISDEPFYSDYTVEERAEIIALGLGIDPENILYNSLGEAYVVLDGEANLAESSTFSDKEIANFGDVTNKAGSTIYKLNGNQKYSMELTDSYPQITLADKTEVYVGIVIDQLYDRHAEADIVVHDVPNYEDETIQNSEVSAYYTSVQSKPYQKGSFTKGSVMSKLSAEHPVLFDAFETQTAKTRVTGQMASILGTSSKTVKIAEKNKTIDGKSFTKYVSLGGSGVREDYRSVTINVKEGQKIQVYAIAGGSEENKRGLVVEYKDAEGNWVKAEPVVSSGTEGRAFPPTNNSVDEFDWEKLQYVIPTSGPVTMYSANSGIDIYGVYAIN